jgi:colanic acid/amylovoran biosynthesis glycosyltransferase
LPVLATRHGPFPEVVGDGVTGFLVPERDQCALAERLIYLIEHPEIAVEMGRRGRRRVEERFDPRMLDRQVVAAYEWAIERFRQRHSLTVRPLSGLLASVAGRAPDRFTVEQAQRTWVTPSSECDPSP